MEKNDTWKLILVLFVGMGMMMFVGVYGLRQEGEKAREAMHQGMHEVAEDAGLGVQKAAQESVATGVEEGMKEAAGAAKEASGLFLDTLSEIGRQGRNDDADDGDSDSTSSDKDKMEKAPSKPEDVVNGLFKIGNEVLKKADDVGQDMFKIDSENEQELGARIHKLLSESDDVKLVNDLDLQLRVTDAAAPFLSRLIRKDIEYTFTIVEDKEVNAFSLPGGYIYVNTGLLDFVKNDKELEFVIGHEIGHVDLRHCMRNYTYAARAGQLGGSLTEAAVLQLYHGYAVAFSEDMEYEADKYSLERMLESGSSVEETLSFSEHMVEYVQSEGGEVEESEPSSVPDAIMQSLGNHFRTHPPSKARLERLKRLAKRKADSN